MRIRQAFFELRLNTSIVIGYKMTQFSGYVGNTPVPKGTQIITQGTLPLDATYIVVPGGYFSGALKLYINGVRQGKDDFIADNGTTIEFMSMLPAGTQYIVERINQFEVSNTIYPIISLIDPRIFNIRYTMDLISNVHVDHSQMTINDTFISRFFDSTRTIGSGGIWQLCDMDSTPPDNVDGLNSDGKIYFLNGSNYLQFTLASTECSPLKFGKGSCLVKELLNVEGGFHGQPMTLGGFWELGDQGGGSFVWDSSKSKTSHDGGTVIDPGKIEDLTGAVVNSGYTTGDRTGEGCWVRIYTGDTDPKWFGS